MTRDVWMVFYVREKGLYNDHYICHKKWVSVRFKSLGSSFAIKIVSREKEKLHLWVAKCLKSMQCLHHPVSRSNCVEMSAEPWRLRKWQEKQWLDSSPILALLEVLKAGDGGLKCKWGYWECHQDNHIILWNYGCPIFRPTPLDGDLATCGAEAHIEQVVTEICAGSAVVANNNADINWEITFFWGGSNQR